MRIWQGFKKIETFNQMVTLKCLDKTRKPPFKMFRPPLVGFRPSFKVFKHNISKIVGGKRCKINYIALCHDV